MNYKTELIKHSEISEDKILKIIALKNKRWQYSEKQHLDWIEENIQPEDYHILIWEDDQPVAYTNFASVEAAANGTVFSFMGIGNVCTASSGKGYGDVLMKAVNNIIKENNWKGMLFCKNSLVPYYAKYHWKLIDVNLVQPEKLSKNNTMIFNLETPLTSFVYNGKDF